MNVLLKLLQALIERQLCSQSKNKAKEIVHVRLEPKGIPYLTNTLFNSFGEAGVKYVNNLSALSSVLAKIQDQQMTKIIFFEKGEIYL